MVTFYRRLPKFDYIKPNSMEEVLRLLADNDNGKYKIYAGGTDVIPKLKGRETAKPEILIDLKGIPDLDYIDYDEEKGLRIGALATIRSVATSSIVSEKFPILSQAAGRIASTQVQNRGTIAGNVCSAVPSADSAPALLCLGADLICVKENGERLIGIDAFFKGPNETFLNPGELLKEIQIPPMPEGSHGVYIKLSPRSRMDLAVVGVAATLRAEDGVMRHIKIGLGAVSPTPMRAREAENMLLDKKADDDLIAQTARRAREESKPISDHRASAEYRKMMVEVLVKRAIHQALSGLPS
jgi:aerobic carbon-monoxide dehydrogenase medium subunit